MQFVFRSHPTTNLDIYVSPECPHDDYDYAKVMLNHFKPYTTGITSTRELKDFKIFLELHNHSLHIINSKELENV